MYIQGYSFWILATALEIIPGFQLTVVNLSPNLLGQLFKALLDKFKESLVKAAGPSIATITSNIVWPIERDSLPLVILSRTENTLSAGPVVHKPDIVYHHEISPENMPNLNFTWKYFLSFPNNKVTKRTKFYVLNLYFFFSYLTCIFPTNT